MNDTQNDGHQQPQILEAQWDAEQIAALFDDLQQGADIKRVQVRSGQHDQAVTLREARQLISQGEANAIQIRYRYDDQDWCDTLIIGAETTRIIRTVDAGCP